MLDQSYRRQSASVQFRYGELQLLLRKYVKFPSFVKVGLCTDCGFSYSLDRSDGYNEVPQLAESEREAVSDLLLYLENVRILILRGFFWGLEDSTDWMLLESGH